METLPLEKELEPLFLRSLPAFPEGLKEGIAQYGPYVVLVLAILTGIALLPLLGIGAALVPFGSVYGILSLIVNLGVIILEIMAFQPLTKRQRRGWNLLYYAQLLSVFGGLIVNLVSSFGLGGVVGTGAVIGTLIGAAIHFFLAFWVLFQIREKYIH